MYELGLTIDSVSVGSVLTYPVDVVLGGGSLSARFGTVELVGALHVNLTGPFGKMLDQDYLQSFEFSHTESHTNAKLWDAEVAARFHVADVDSRWGAMPVALVAGFRHSRNEFDVYGLNGWQGLGGPRVDVSLPESVHGIHYVSVYEMPFLGLRLDGEPSPVVSVSAEVRLLAAWSTHDDDHVLRNKTAHADMQSFGWAVNAEARWSVSSHVFIGGLGEMQVVHGSGGTLSQRFYADDPTSPNVEGPTTAIPNSSFSFQHDRWRLLALAGAQF